MRSFIDRGRSARRWRPARRPNLEVLEGRRLPASFTVTSGADDGPGTLRAAIAAANDEAAYPGPDAIAIAPSAGRVTLTSGPLRLTGDVTITGPSGGATIARSAASGAPQFGIFVVASDATATLASLTITGGRTSSGAGIYNSGALTVSDVTLGGNSASGFGGGLYNAGTLIVSGSTFSDNAAGGYGGGLYNGSGVATIWDSTFVGNTSGGLGGAIFNSGSLLVVGSTLNRNSAGSLGGGIRNFGQATLNNTIVANSPSGGDLAGAFDGAHDLIRDGSGGLDPATNLLGVDPELGDLADNGGPTRTYALPIGSPAINAGDNALSLGPDGGPLRFDQRGPGFARIAGGTVDIGAFERQNRPPVAVGDAYVTDEDTSLVVDARTGVLGDDSDPDGDAITAALVENVPAAAGSVALNADGSFTYTPAPNFNGTTSFLYKANDGKIDGNTVAVTITVTPVNDVPVFALLGPVTVAEDSGPYAAIQAAGIDDGDPEVAQALGFAVSNSDNALFSAQPTIDPTGMLTFTPAPDANGTATVWVTLTDDGTAGGPARTTAAQSFTITVTPVNDAPVVAVPGAQSLDEDTGLVFSSAGGNTIRVTDVDAGAGPIQVRLTVGSGSLTLAGVAGLSFNEGDGATDVTMTFTGTLAAIDAALDGLAYAPAADFNGAVSLSILADDLGNSGAGGSLTDQETIPIAVLAVNDPPVLTAPGVQEAAESGAATIPGLSVADVDALEGDGVVEVRLSVASGTLSVGTGLAGGLTAGQVAGNGTGAVALRGPIAAVNATLAAGVTYLGNLNFHGGDALTATADDLGNRGLGGPMTDTKVIPIRVLSPAEQIAGLRTRVAALRQRGALNGGQSTSLLAKLNRADVALARGQQQVAYNVIGAFVAEAESLAGAGALTASQSEPLLAGGRRLRRSLLIGGGS